MPPFQCSNYIFSLRNIQKGGKAMNLAVPHFLAMDVGQWSTSESDHFIPDLPCKEGLRPLDITAVVIINY